MLFIRVIRGVFFLLLYIGTIGFGYSQESEGTKISKEDSIGLADTWKSLMPYLLQKTESTTSMIADTLYCDLCLEEGQSTINARMDRGYFQNKGLPILNHHKKIKDTILNEKPDYGMIVYENEDYSVRPVWVISYTYWKPDELAKGHEGASVLFEFRKIDSGFELFQISTIP